MGCKQNANMQTKFPISPSGLRQTKSGLLVCVCNDSQSSIPVLLQQTKTNHLGNAFPNFLSFKCTANPLLERSNGCLLIGQVAGANVIEQPIDPFATLGDRYDVLGAEAQLLSGGPGNACAPMYVLERECCGTEPTPGCSDSSEADRGFGSTGEEGAQCGVLVDAVVNHASKVEIFVLGHLIRPWQLGDLLLDRALDVDQLLGGAVPAVKLATLRGEVSGHLPWQQLWLGIPGTQFRVQHQEAIEQAVIDCLTLQRLE